MSRDIASIRLALSRIKKPIIVIVLLKFSIESATAFLSTGSTATISGSQGLLSLFGLVLGITYTRTSADFGISRKRADFAALTSLLLIAIISSAYDLFISRYFLELITNMDISLNMFTVADISEIEISMSMKYLLFLTCSFMATSAGYIVGKHIINRNWILITIIFVLTFIIGIGTFYFTTNETFSMDIYNLITEAYPINRLYFVEILIMALNPLWAVRYMEMMIQTDILWNVHFIDILIALLSTFLSWVVYLTFEKNNLKDLKKEKEYE